MRLHIRTFVPVLLSAGIACAASDPVREGAGPRREKLDAMELKAFPASAWGSLSDWTGGEGLDTAQTDGKVVVILTWASWNPHSKGAVRNAQRLASKHAGNDLIVVGVHDSRRWGDDAKSAGEGMLLAHDADGAFRSTLMVDQDPDFYIIDRAGHLRYADIETTSVSGAVSELLAESRADAADYPAKLERLAASQSAFERQFSGVQEELDLSDMPDFPFVAPELEAYNRVDWPNRWESFESDVLDIRNDNSFGGGGSDDPVRTFVPPEEGENMWGRKLRSYDGRATVMYFWSPDIIGSYQRIQPMMDRLQRELWRDVNVIGVMTRIPPRNDSGFNQNDDGADERSRERFKGLVQNAKVKRTYEHTIVADADYAILSSLLNLDQNFSGPRENFNARFSPVAIFSSDKSMRWIGLPQNSRFRTALDQTLRVDPGVAQRRLVEEAWIRQRQQ